MTKVDTNFTIKVQSKDQRNLVTRMNETAIQYHQLLHDLALQANRGVTHIDQGYLPLPLSSSASKLAAIEAEMQMLVDLSRRFLSEEDRGIAFTAGIGQLSIEVVG